MKRQREIKDTIRYLPFGQINPTMGKKGKRGDKPAEKKAILKRIDALAKKLEEELKGADLFAPLPPMDDCPICLVRLPRMDNSKLYQGCCGKYICFACFKENYRVIEKMNGLIKGGAEKKKIESACPFCREPDPIGGKYLRQLEFRGLRGDAHAYSLLGIHYGFTMVRKRRDRSIVPFAETHAYTT